MPSLSGFPYYNQRDSQWDSLCSPSGYFEGYGCGVCCAAMITEYIEGGTKDPSVMKQRGVFTTTNLETQWSNMSNMCAMSGNQNTNNLTAALTTIRNQIALSVPVLIKIFNSAWPHFVVAYGYSGSGTSASQIYIKDPYGGYSTLGAAMNVWPTYEFCRKIMRTV